MCCLRSLVAVYKVSESRGLSGGLNDQVAGQASRGQPIGLPWRVIKERWQVPATINPEIEEVLLGVCGHTSNAALKADPVSTSCKFGFNVEKRAIGATLGRKHFKQLQTKSTLWGNSVQNLSRLQ